MNMELREEAYQWAKSQMPKEACGVVIIEKGKEVFIPCRNDSPINDAFVMNPDDYANAEDRGEIVRIVHSHVFLSPEPSDTDLVSCEVVGLPWSIVSVPNGIWKDINPSGYKAPLVGRQWCHGLLDCYSLIRDWYSQELGIELVDFERDFEWWNKGQNLYVENFKTAGFFEVDLENVQKHDVLLMQVASPVVNHGAVYLGDDLILHHLHRRLSSRDVFAGYWRRNTVKVLRHENYQALR